MAIQPITEPVSVNPVSKKDCDWLLGSFLFGTEIGGSQLKQTPCINISQIYYFLWHKFANEASTLLKGPGPKFPHNGPPVN